MGNESEKADVIAGRFSAFKKAGMPSALLIVMMVLSTPGFYNWLFDHAGQKAAEADKKADAAYEVLKNEVLHLREDDARLQDEIRELRAAMMDLVEIRRSDMENVSRRLAEAQRASEAPRPRSAPLRAPAMAPEALSGDPLDEPMLDMSDGPVLEERGSLPRLSDVVGGVE